DLTTFEWLFSIAHKKSNALSIAPQNLVLDAFFTLLQLLGRIFSLFLIDVHFVHFSPRPVARPAPQPSIAQLVERRTVVEQTDILRSLVRLRLEGRVAFCRSFSARSEERPGARER